MVARAARVVVEVVEEAVEAEAVVVVATVGRRVVTPSISRQDFKW